MAISQSFSTTRPSLNLNFARAKTLDPHVTFARASTGTYVGADGLVKTASADTARFTYDPATGESLGLLVEESRTNLWVNSTSIVSSNPPVYGNWNQASTTANTVVAPDGTTTADTITPGSPSASVIQRFSATAGTTYTFSIYVKRNPGSDNTYLDRFGFVVAWSNNGSTLTGNATFELVPGSSATNVLTDQWKRFSFSYTCPAGAISMEMGISNRNSGTGSPGYSVLAWGAQVEAGSYATSYIPTSGSTVTRQADKPILLGSAITPLGRSFAPSGLISIGTENSTIASSGGGSVVFDGNGDYLSTPSTADFAIKQGDFTIEMWVYPLTAKEGNTILSLGTGMSNLYWTVMTRANSSFAFGSGNGAWSWESKASPADLSSNSNLVPINTWTHIAIQRVGTSLVYYCNGNLVNSFGNAPFGTATQGGTLHIGTYFQNINNDGSWFDGYVSNLRIVKGRAVYTSNFTPIAPLKSVNGTVLLCCNSPTSATFEATGKTLAANSNASPSTQAPVSLAFDAQASDTNTVSNVLYYPVPLASATVASMRNAYVPIVKDDLVLHLDAGYNKSYSGSGTTWYDLSGKGNNGTINGAGYINTNSGVLTFDGTDDIVTVLGGGSLNISSTITVMVWVYYISGSGRIFQKDGPIYTRCWEIGGYEGAFRMEMWHSNGQATIGYGSPLAINGWTHLALTFDGTNIKMYQNSTLVSTINFPGDIRTDANTPIILGGYWGGEYFNGRISNAQIYNRALTATEVTQNFNALRNRFGT